MTDTQQAPAKRGNPFTPEMRAKAAATRAANKAKKQKALPQHPPPLKYNVPASEFAGMNEMNCCTACDEKKCVISGRPYCAHPFKGGLHASQMSDKVAIARFNNAKYALRNKSLNPDKIG